METVTHKDGVKRPNQKYHRNNTPVDLDDEDDNNEKEEAEAALAVLVEQGKEVAAEASRASSSI